MKRLLDIGRESGFPLCAETLTVLNENSEMLAEWLKEIPLQDRQAVKFGDYLLVRRHFHKRVVKLGVVSAASMDQCSLAFRTETESVTDGTGNTIDNVWRTEWADIVDETTPALKWTVFSLPQVFELNMWRNLTEEFASLLTSATVSYGSMVNYPSLAAGTNTMRISSDGTRIQLDFAVSIDIFASQNTLVRIPIPFTCRNGVRLNANLKDSTGTNWPVRAVILDGRMVVNIGRWLRDDIGWTPAQGDANGLEHCIDVITVNQEVLCI